MKIRTLALIAFAILLFIGGFPLFAESGFPPQSVVGAEIPITLSDVVNLILDRNLDVTANRLTPVSTRLQTLALQKFLQPTLTFGGSVNRDTSASTTQLNGAQSLSQLRHGFSTTLSQTLASGTTLSAVGTMNRTSSNSSLNTYNPSYSGKITYSATQHLLQGRTRVVNLRQILQSQNNEKISEAQFEIQLITLLVTAQKTYWDLVFSGEDLKVKQDSLKLAERTLEENKARVEIGTMAPIDVKQTESDVVARKELVIVANGALIQSEDQIKKLISSETDPALFLIRLRTLESPRRPPDTPLPGLDEAVKVALENRPELRQAKLDEQNRDLDVQYTKDQKLPILDITATFNQNGTGGTQAVRNGFGAGAVDTIPGGLGDAVGQLFGYGYKGYGLSFNLAIPIKNRAAEADFSRAVNERRLSDSKLNSTKQNIVLDVRTVLVQAETNRARIETARTARELAEIKLDAEKAKFDLGVSTLRFVLEEQRNVVTAQTNELQAVVNYTKSLTDLDRAMGVTLKKNNVEIDKALAPAPGGQTSIKVKK